MPTAAEIGEDVLKTDAYLVSAPLFMLYETYDYANKSLQENAEKLEKEHKILLATLALTNNTYCNLYKRFHPAFMKMQKEGIKYTDSEQFTIITKLGAEVLQKAKDWFSTQYYLEKNAKIPSTKIKLNDFLDPNKAKTILKEAQGFFREQAHVRSGVHGKIGSPVVAIVWASAIIVSGISIAYIVHRMTISTQDRIDLMNKVKQTCSDLKLSPEECTSVLNTSQTEETKNAKAVTDTASAVGSSISKIILFGGLGLAAVLFVTHKSSSK